jgi:16S rRNA (uracil1498-N3)-methyltransferase
VKQFLLRDFPAPDGRVILSGKDYHYLVRVRRVKAGDMLSAALPDGSPARLTVISAKENVLVCGVNREEAPAETLRRDDRPAIILLQAVPQPAKMDLLVRQSTEGGVYAIVPFVSRHSVKAAQAASRLERWRRIVREARQQSGSQVATTVEDVRYGVDEALSYYRETWIRAAARGETTVALLLHEKENGADGAFHRALASCPDTVFVAIGPEGGLADEETAAFVQDGFAVINMGPNVLRVETAAAWAVGVVSVMLRESVLWESRKSLKP